MIHWFDQLQFEVMQNFRPLVWLPLDPLLILVDGFQIEIAIRVFIIAITIAAVPRDIVETEDMALLTEGLQLF